MRCMCTQAASCAARRVVETATLAVHTVILSNTWLLHCWCSAAARALRAASVASSSACASATTTPPGCSPPSTSASSDWKARSCASAAAAALAWQHGVQAGRPAAASSKGGELIGRAAPLAADVGASGMRACCSTHLHGHLEGRLLAARARLQQRTLRRLARLPGGARCLVRPLLDTARRRDLARLLPPARLCRHGCCFPAEAALAARRLHSWCCCLSAPTTRPVAGLSSSVACTGLAEHRRRENQLRHESAGAAVRAAREALPSPAQQPPQPDARKNSKPRHAALRRNRRLQALLPRAGATAWPHRRQARRRPTMPARTGTAQSYRSCCRSWWPRICARKRLASACSDRCCAASRALCTESYAAAAAMPARQRPCSRGRAARLGRQPRAAPKAGGAGCRCCSGTRGRAPSTAARCAWPPRRAATAAPSRGRPRARRRST